MVREVSWRYLIFWWVCTTNSQIRSTREPRAGCNAVITGSAQVEFRDSAGWLLSHSCKFSVYAAKESGARNATPRPRCSPHILRATVVDVYTSARNIHTASTYAPSNIAWRLAARSRLSLLVRPRKARKARETVSLPSSSACCFNFRKHLHFRKI